MTSCCFVHWLALSCEHTFNWCCLDVNSISWIIITLKDKYKDGLQTQIVMRFVENWKKNHENLGKHLILDTNNMYYIPQYCLMLCIFLVSISGDVTEMAIVIVCQCPESVGSEVSLSLLPNLFVTSKADAKRAQLIIQSELAKRFEYMSSGFASKYFLFQM